MPIYRVSSLQNLLGQRMLNVLHYDVDVALSGADGEEFAEAIRDAYIDTNFRGDMSTSWSFVGIELRRVDIPDQPSIEVAPTSGSLLGTAAANILPTQVALLISGTALTAFPRRVRTYCAGLTEAASNNSEWGAATITRALAFAADMDSHVGVLWEALRVAVRYTSTGAGPFVDAFNRVQTYSVTNIPATQRRRRIGVGI